MLFLASIERNSTVKVLVDADSREDAKKKVEAVDPDTLAFEPTGGPVVHDIEQFVPTFDGDQTCYPIL